MSQRIVLFFSITLTAFILVILGAVIGLGRQVPAASVDPTLDPQLAAQLQAREAEYQALIEQANAQLSAAGSTATPDAAQASNQPATPAYPVSPDTSASIALQAVPNSYLIQTPDLVSFQGTVAYEVTLNSGLVYIDATTGQILYNSALAVSGNRRAGNRQESGDD